MYRIAICDDEKDFAEQLCTMSKRVLIEANIQYEIQFFLSIHELAAQITANPKQFDLLLLDILFDKENGIDAARKLRASGYSASIIFVTSCEDYLRDGYCVGAKRYLLKPLVPAELKEALLADYKEGHEPKHIVLTNSSQIRPILIDSIYFIESRGHKVFIHTREGETMWYGKLQQMEEQLEQNRFLRCHKSYLVNATSIVIISKRNITLVSGETLPISKFYEKRVEEQFIAYLENK